jgi:hypothetical protein
MSQVPQRKPSPEELLALEEQARARHARREQAAREIEGQAGLALQARFWRERVMTPFGEFSRRALFLLALGLVLTCGFYSLLIYLRLQSLPAVVTLPPADAQTLMTHVHANFAGQKDEAFSPFIPESALEVWRFESAYRFTWRDQAQNEYVVMLLTYANYENMSDDFLLHTRWIRAGGHGEAIFTNPALVAEFRDRQAYGGDWKGLNLGNAIILLSANTPPAASQELYSHFVSITASNHREAVPTATPFR